MTKRATIRIAEHRGVAGLSPFVETLPPSNATLTCQIDKIEEGVLAGRVMGHAGLGIETLFLFVGRRTIARVPITWSQSAIARDPDGHGGTFRFDLRFLPPDLLLSPKLKVEIRAKRDDPAVLSKIEIDTADVLDARALPKRQRGLEGFLDATEGGAIRGWVWDPRAPHRRIKLHLFIDKVFCGVFEAALPRHDLEATGRGDGAYGFAIPAQDFFARSGSSPPRVELVSLEPEFWHVPLAPHAVPRPWYLRMPRPRRIPQTVREFAALLASNEPFPKKVYALERLEKMPDSFSADYLLLGLEFLRIEMVKNGETAPTTWSSRLLTWWRQRLIRGQLARLTALAEAAAASKALLDRVTRPLNPLIPAGDHRERP